MKFSESWLREWVNPNISSEMLSDQLTMAGLEVEGIEPVAGHFTGVVVGRVMECKQHPNADKLRITKVDIGQPELLNIVCGAPNCRQGLVVACATIGAVLPGDFKIKPAKLRGEPSEGMLCSYSELGIADDQNGIIELPADAPLGMDIRHYLQLDDNMIEISVTPNRADCFGIIGVARDIATINQLKLAEPNSSKAAVTIDDTIKVNIEAPKAAPRYLARIVKGINVNAATPLWMKEKLRRSGIRSVDAVVDITNYVLMELGHPMHAFDLQKIDGAITVRYAKSQEKLVLLDGNEINIKTDTLVIADDNQPLALAGIFGGNYSGVSEQTKDVLLEAAFFSPLAIVGKAREYGLHTDASHRYERGVDPTLQYQAMERATTLLLAICGGEAGPIIDVTHDEQLPKPSAVNLRLEKVNTIIGYQIDPERIIAILTGLGCQVVKQEQWLEVHIPSWRFDLQIEEDLIEEIARIYGYNKIPNSLMNIELALTAQPEQHLPLIRAKQLLVDRGYQEAITYSFVDPKKQQLLHPQQTSLTLPNPISNEMSTMRLSLWTGLLDAVVYNQNRQQTRIRLFESGLRFVPDESSEFSVRQETVLSGVITGNVNEEHWDLPKQPVNFYDLKGDVEAILALTGKSHDIVFQVCEHSALHPGQSAAIYLRDELVGFIGTLHPQLEKSLELKGKAILFELYWDKFASRKVPEFSDISRFPANRRDIAIIVDRSVNAADILSECKRVGGENLVGVNLFDVYQGDNIAQDKKSLAISLILQDNSRTLEETDIAKIIDKCIAALHHRFDALLRE
jgi:phenylalanyl-tRNA synthetase beta chain